MTKGRHHWNEKLGLLSILGMKNSDYYKFMDSPTILILNNMLKRVNPLTFSHEPNIIGHYPYSTKLLN